jgi:2'-5' RNA ligase
MFGNKVAYSYSCLMAKLPKLVADKVKEYAAFIPDKFIYNSRDGEQGREDDPHITIKYGIHTIDLKEVLELLNDQVPFRVRLGHITSFVNEKNIVLKVNVQGDSLTALNRKVCNVLECTDTFPEYRPHITVAYLRKNDRNPHYFLDYCNNSLDGLGVIVDTLIFSVPGGKKHLIELGGIEHIAEELVGIADVLTKV